VKNRKRTDLFQTWVTARLPDLYLYPVQPLAKAFCVFGEKNRTLLPENMVLLHIPSPVLIVSPNPAQYPEYGTKRRIPGRRHGKNRPDYGTAFKAWPFFREEAGKGACSPGPIWNNPRILFIPEQQKPGRPGFNRHPFTAIFNRKTL
jgi:hypothetical protein